VTLDVVVEALRDGGFVAAEAEAVELVRRADADRALLASLLQRRLTGEPLAWVVGQAHFAGIDLSVDHGVYVPRPHTAALARRAARRLPPAGVAVDVCTGSGAVAAVLQRCRPGARVIATDVEPAAIACARTNGVVALLGDLLEPVPERLRGRVDVVVGVVPYVPTASLALLQRDTFAFESSASYDGGVDGLDVLRQLARDAVEVLRPAGLLLVELGGDQAAVLAPELEQLGYRQIIAVRDDDGDVRGIEAAVRSR
jgi:release factor glutamine methyltransferase